MDFPGYQLSFLAPGDSGNYYMGPSKIAKKIAVQSVYSGSIVTSNTHNPCPKSNCSYTVECEGPEYSCHSFSERDLPSNLPFNFSDLLPLEPRVYIGEFGGGPRNISFTSIDNKPVFRVGYALPTGDYRKYMKSGFSASNKWMASIFSCEHHFTINMVEFQVTDGSLTARTTHGERLGLVLTDNTARKHRFTSPIRLGDQDYLAFAGVHALSDLAIQFLECEIRLN